MSINSKVSVSKRKLTLAFALISIICMATFIPLGYVLGQGGGSTPITISSGVYAGAPTYTIWTDGSTYYAKTAYGVATSSTNPTTLINSVAISNSLVLVKTGTYVLSSTIIFNALTNFIFKGEGNATIFQVAASTNINAFIITDCQSSTFSSFQIDGNRASNTYAGSWQNGGIFAGDSVGTSSDKNCLFENLYIHDTQGDAVSLRNSADTTIQNNWISNTLRDGIFASISNNIIVTANHVTNCGSTNDISNKWHSIYCYGGNIVITNNIVTYAGSDGIEVYGLQRGTITNNIITYANRNGIYVNSGTITGETQIIISNNVIEHAGQNASESWRYGIFINGASGTMVIGNQVSYSGTIGIYASTSNNIAISNNKVSNSTTQGIDIYQSSNVLISSNVIEGNTAENGLELSSVSYSVINGNNIRGNSLLGSGYAVADVTYSSITGNIVDHSYYGFLISSSSNNVYSNNFAYTCSNGPLRFSNSGTAIIAAGGTINHGLGVTPTSVQLSLLGNRTILVSPYSLDSSSIAVSMLNMTSMNDPTGTFTVYWKVDYQP